MKTCVEIDVENIVNSLNTDDKNKLVEKLAINCLTVENLIELALKKDSYEKIIDYIYTNKVPNKTVELDESLINYYKENFLNYIMEKRGIVNDDYARNACHYFTVQDIEHGMNYMILKILKLLL